VRTEFPREVEREAQEVVAVICEDSGGDGGTEPVSALDVAIDFHGPDGGNATGAEGGDRAVAIRLVRLAAPH
jgi:hypothetical protein